MTHKKNKGKGKSDAKAKALRWGCAAGPGSKVSDVI
jgi:hypothetical protein